MADSVNNMSLDDIIKASRSRGRGGTGVRGRGRGGGTGRGRGRGRGIRRGRSQARGNTPESRSRSRSRSRPGVQVRWGRGGRAPRRARSRSHLPRSSASAAATRPTARSRSRSRSRSQLRGQTPTQNPLFRAGGPQRRRSRSIPNEREDIHSRLGVTTRRGLAVNVSKPLALAKRGISKRGRGLTTRNRYSMVGLRSDQILKEQRQNLLFQNNVIRSQTFTRSRNNSLSRSKSRSRSNSRSRNNSLSRNNTFNSPTQLTVSVANNLAKRRRRNSNGNTSYLNEQSLVQLTNQLGGYRNRGGPGSVNSVGSTRSNRSNKSAGSGRARARGRGRGRARGRGVSGRFSVKPVLNPKLQKEIAVIQGKPLNQNQAAAGEPPAGINCTPTPASTTQTLHQRFACS